VLLARRRERCLVSQPLEPLEFAQRLGIVRLLDNYVESRFLDFRRCCFIRCPFLAAASFRQRQSFLREEN
jgi:hypothetical protein